MAISSSLFTVLFEDPFWIGLYTREDGGRYTVCKITFGAEPKDYEVYEFLLGHWSELIFSPPVKSTQKSENRINPKRMQRLIRRQAADTGVGTKAQQALSLQREQGKLARQAQSKAQRKAEAERRFALRQKKRLEKHRGN